MTGRDHEVRDAAEEIDEVVDYLFQREPRAAVALSDALFKLMPDVVDRFMPAVMAQRNQLGNF